MNNVRIAINKVLIAPELIVAYVAKNNVITISIHFSITNFVSPVRVWTLLHNHCTGINKTPSSHLIMISSPCIQVLERDVNPDQYFQNQYTKYKRFVKVSKVGADRYQLWIAVVKRSDLFTSRGGRL